MATKKTLRNVDYHQKKSRKTRKRLHLVVIGVFLIFLLFVFFILLFDHIFKPVEESRQPGKREMVAVTLFFSDPNERFLVKERRFVPLMKEPSAQATEIVKALLEGSKGELVDTFPQGVPLNELKISDGTALVDFGRQLRDLHPGGTASEMATVYSLTNSLIANIPEIQRVALLVDGARMESIKGHLDAGRYFAYNKDYVAPAARDDIKKR